MHFDIGQYRLRELSTIALFCQDNKTTHSTCCVCGNISTGWI